MTATPWSPAGPELPTVQVMHQGWHDICFLHWRVDPAVVAPLLPAGTRPDVCDGSAWVGLIPFRMVGAGMLTGPSVPWLGDFLELNVRTYAVDADNRHGVVFCTLEAQRLAVVLGAQAVFGLPYRWAHMTYAETTGPDGPVLSYVSHRFGPRRAVSRMRVGLGAEIAEPDPLAVFLTARFGLHTRQWGRTLWVPNTHDPWPLRHGTLLDLDDDLLAETGFGADLATRAPDSVLVSRGVRTRFGAPIDIGAGGQRSGTPMGGR